jgi:hypothetical protein
VKVVKELPWQLVIVAITAVIAAIAISSTHTSTPGQMSYISWDTTSATTYQPSPSASTTLAQKAPR